MASGHYERISGRSDYRRLLREGRSLRGEWFTLKVLPNGKHNNRFGCTIRRTVSPTAVFRNRIKRWFREIFRRNQRIFPLGLDLAVVVSKAPAKASYASIEQTFLAIWEQFTRESSSR